MNRESIKETIVEVNLSDEQLQQLSGFALLDETNIGEQIRLATKEYVGIRLASETLPQEIDNAKQRRIQRDNRAIIETQIAELGLSDFFLSDIKIL